MVMIKNGTTVTFTSHPFTIPFYFRHKRKRSAAIPLGTES